MREVVAVTVNLELPLGTRVLGDTVARDQIQDLSKGASLESA